MEELLALVREHMGEPAELLDARLRRAGGARSCGRGPAARRVGRARRGQGGAFDRRAGRACPQPESLFGWRAFAAARTEGARVVLHLHQYRLGVRQRRVLHGGRECTRCHGRNTLPGVIHNCRGQSRRGACLWCVLALWQRTLWRQADAVIVPSRVRARTAARAGRAAGLGAGPRAPLRRWRGCAPRGASTPARGTYALGRLAARAREGGRRRDRGVPASPGVPLVVAGDGPQMGDLRARGAGNRGGLVKESRAHAGHPKTEHPHPSPPPEPTTPPSGENDPRPESMGGAVRFLGRVDDTDA